MIDDDLRFYNAPLKGTSGIASRVVRRLCLPFFDRLTAILETILERIGDVDRRLVRLEGEDTSSRVDQLDGKVDAINCRVDAINNKVDAINNKLDTVNNKFDSLNAKFDQLNVKFERLNTKFEELNNIFKSTIDRQSKVEETVHSIASLHWDHIAVTRRLAQLEDRFVNAPAKETDDSGTSIPFPGFDRERLGQEKVG